MKKIDNIIDNLVEYSGNLFEIIYDDKLEIPGLSILIKDRFILRHKIILNYELIKNEDISVIAHILSHEWGHHIYKHTYINPQTLSNEEKEKIELEADKYAYDFIKYYNYDLDKVIHYIKKNHINDINMFEKKVKFLYQRLNILYEK
jgi:hypothetical protein